MRTELLDPRRRNTRTINVNQTLIDKLKVEDYLVVDIETDGLMYDYTKVWVICIYDPTNKRKLQFYENLEEALDYMRGRLLVMHNGLKFDQPILENLFGDRAPKPTQIIDTLVLSRLGNPSRSGGHSLEAWGERLGIPKVEHGDWSHFSMKMVERCAQDCMITYKVMQRLTGMFSSFPVATEIEHSVAWQTGKAERRGFCFDVKKAEELYAKLTTDYQETLAKIQKLWPPRKVPKNKTRPNVLKEEVFTGSRRQAADRLIKKYGWKPKVFSDGGVPEISEETLSEMNFEEAPLLLKLYNLEKKLSFLKSREKNKRKNGWLDVVHPDGKIRPTLNYNGAYTHRMTCSSPNLQQVSSEGEMRELWISSPGYVLVGVDAKALELRLLAHYVAKYDGGAWAKEVLSGDPHTANQHAMGLWSRDTAKRIIYAYPYGAGDSKLGSIWLVDDKDNWEKIDCAKKNKGNPEDWKPRWEVLGLTHPVSKTEIGKAIKKLPLFGAIERVKKAGVISIREKGYVHGLDGRKVRSDTAHSYSVIATLCQSAGAIVMKAAIYLCPVVFDAYGLVDGVDYHFVMYIHDEFQIECLPEKKELVKAAGIEAIQLAGEMLNLRIPMDGDGKDGMNWKETH